MRHGRHWKGFVCALLPALAAWLLLLLLLPDSARGRHCNNVPRVPGYMCDCDSRFGHDDLGGWHLSCYDAQANEPQQAFVVEYAINDIVRVQCDTAAPYQAAFFQNFSVSEVERFSFSYCPMPNGSFAQVLEGLEVTSLQLISCQIGDTLDARLFEGLNKLKRLTVTGSKDLRFIPEDAFTNLTTLVNLELNNNALQDLPEKVFWPLKNMTSIQLGSNVLQSLHSSQFRGLDKLISIYLYKNNLTVLPQGIFTNLTSVKNLDLLLNSLTNITDKDLADLTGIENLKLGGNPFTMLPDTLFKHNRLLGDLNLSVLNKLGSPPERLLTGLSRLENITLLDCNFTSIPEKFFAYAGNMKNIRMVNNRLTSLPANLFRENTKLLNLDLSYNDLTELPLTVFEKQFVLETLVFYRNNFVTLKAGPFDNLISLKVLSFEYNFIESIEQETFQRLQKLEDLKLGRNKLKMLEGNAPFGLNKKLRRVDLSRNKLIQFPDINWDIYLALEKLNLDYNNITYLRVPNLISTSTEVSLRFNKIKAVQVTELEILKKYETREKTYNTDTASEHYYHLDGNPFECNCQLYDFIKYLSENNQKDIALFKNSPAYTCESPKVLKGKNLLEVDLEQLTCTIKEGCPDECTCYFRRMDYTTHMDCRQGNLTSLPLVSPPNTNILYLQNNQISTIEDLDSHQWENLTELHLDDNDLRVFDAKRLPRRLHYLSLTNNSLRSMTPELMAMFANSSATLSLSLSGNPWTCDCSTFPFKVWLRGHVYMIKDYLDIACGEKISINNTLALSYINEIPDSVYCPTDYSAQRKQLAAVSVICVVLAVLLVVVLILYYRNRQTIIAYVYIHFYNVFVCVFSEEDLDEDKTYDAFVSYSSADRDIAMALLNSLETNEEKFKLCIHERDWLPGYNISWNIVNSVQNSRRTILVVSKDFLESLWFQVEFHTAYYQMLEDRVDRLIVIVRGELPPKETLDKELKFLLTTKTYLIWGERWFWEKLKYAMPHRKQVPPTNKLAMRNRPNTAMVKTVEEQIANLTAGQKQEKAREKQDEPEEPPVRIENNNQDQTSVVAPPRKTLRGLGTLEPKVQPV
ncbi:uncharacterized protein [Dermacentor andersoni]|nr:protein toll-like isoform X3 [Dermacentor andersoni]XP_050038611.1 protein toll-like isoform X3 [Dermacentor andersoni]XP_054929438.1 protein toll-like isoform X3 [Dermacentor andersoni]XP_054929439.1 protein toll-like isoform X3 [Dermacentor andersoni]